MAKEQGDNAIALRHRTGIGGGYDCAICGAEWMGHLELWLCVPGGYRWLVCPSCVQRGPDAIGERMLVQAAALAAQVDAMRQAAHELRSKPPRWPSRRKLNETIEKAEPW
jgi:hypothetical protein